MALLGREPWVARAVAVASGVVAVLLCFLAARRLGASPRAALLGCLVASAFPYSAWLGVATVPELLTAALIVFAAACASDAPSGRGRLLGALALMAASLSRYEAWPVAGVYAILCLADAREAPRAGLAAVIAVAGPLAWMVHGVLHHESALFFVKRVADYQRAIGASPESWALAALHKPLAYFRTEPELTGSVVLLGAYCRRHGVRIFRRTRRTWWCLGALLAFLVAADVRGASATHHAERVLLAPWLMSALALGTMALALGAPSRSGRTRLPTVALVGLLLVASAWLRPWFARRDGFIDRSVHLALGHAARLAAPGQRVVVDTPDFAFYAILAGHTDPRLALPLDDMDPRHAREEDAFQSCEALSRTMHARGATLLVTTGASHRNLARGCYEEVLRAGELSLLRSGSGARAPAPPP